MFKEIGQYLDELIGLDQQPTKVCSVCRSHPAAEPICVHCGDDE